MREEQRLAVLTAWPIATLREHLSPTTALPAAAGPGCDRHARGLAEAPARHPRAPSGALAASYSDIGDEIAEYFPKVTLLGSFGWTADTRERYRRQR